MDGNGRMEDVFPVEGGDIPASYVGLLEGYTKCESYYVQLRKHTKCHLKRGIVQETC